MPSASRSRFSRRRAAIFVICLLAVLGLGAAGAYVGAAWWIKNRGIVLQPSRAHEPAQVTYFLQNDPAWADAVMGESGDRLGSSGCLVCSLATSLVWLGAPVDPADVNQRFVANAVYDTRGQVIWPQITAAFPGFAYRVLVSE